MPWNFFGLFQRTRQTRVPERSSKRKSVGNEQQAILVARQHYNQAEQQQVGPPDRTRLVTQHTFLRAFLERHGFTSVSSERSLGSERANDGYYPLHVAAQYGDHEILGLLLESRVDVEQLSPKGLTAIEVAEAENRRPARDAGVFFGRPRSDGVAMSCGNGSHSYVLFLLRDAVALKRQEERQHNRAMSGEVLVSRRSCDCTGIGCNNCEQLFRASF
eukprot:g26329.t1